MLILRGILLVLVLTMPALAQPGLPFGWPLPTDIRVTGTVETAGTVVVGRFRLILRALDEADDLEMRIADYELVSLNGIPGGDPRVASMAQNLTASMAAVPLLRIGRDGVAGKAVGFDAIVEAVTSKELFGTDPAVRERTRAMLLDPRMRPIMEARVMELWRTWVESWVGFDLAPGEVYEKTLPMEMSGRTVDQRLRYEHLGPAPGKPCCVGLRLQAHMQGPQALALMRDLIARMVGEGRQSDRIEDVQRTVTTEVVTDPKTLRPVRSVTTDHRAITAGGRTTEQTERKTYEFGWPDLN